jgi:thymidylate synthase (FAD)
MLVFPPKLTGMEVKYPADLAVKNHHRKSLRLYNMMMDAGVCREQARGVLPQNLYTEYYGTVNMSNLLKFIDLRSHEGAQWEIQRVAEACLEIAGDLWPIATKAYRDGKDLKPPALEEENKLLKAEMQRLRRSIC